MSDTHEATVNRVRKLLRLARNNGNENEAASALAMAQKIMMEHDIQDVEDAVEQIAVRGEWKSFRVNQKWQQFLSSAVAELYSCRVVISKRTGQVRFYGKQSSILVAADTLDWVNDQVTDLFKQALKAFQKTLGGGGRINDHAHTDFRNSFKEACALRVYQRVKEIIARARNEIPGHMSLIVIDQAKAHADDLMKEDSVKMGRQMKIKSGFGTGAGRAAGDQVKLKHELR
jgi:hypothetical protein